MSINQRVGYFLGVALLWSSSGYADSMMEFQVNEGGKNSLQPVWIKDGRILVKAAGGDPNTDILYQQGNGQVFLIDHKAQRYTPVTDQKVSQIARQAEDLRPVIRGIGEQLSLLSPKQKAKWEQILGGISIDDFLAAQKATDNTSLARTGVDKRIAGIACAEMNILKSGTKAAELCLADPAALKLPENDAATLQSLVDFTQRLASKAQGLAGQFGIALPTGGIGELAGVPIELRDFSGQRPVAMTLSRISDGAVSADALQVPYGYRAKELSLW